MSLRTKDPASAQPVMNRRGFLRLTGATGSVMSLAGTRLLAQTTPTSPAAIRFAAIGEFGQNFPDRIFPFDRVAAMMRRWNPDFIVSVGDNNYQLGLNMVNQRFPIPG